MNAKQRRQLNRKTKYHITIRRNDGETWDDYDNRCEKAVGWVKQKCKGAYVIENGFSAGFFKFEKESDAVMFGLMYI